jgi:hypothetical protein
MRVAVLLSSSSAYATQISAGTSLFDPNQNKVGTVEGFMTMPDGQDAAVVLVNTTMGLPVILLPTDTVQQGGDGALTVRASSMELAFLPEYVPGQSYAYIPF